MKKYRVSLCYLLYDDYIIEEKDEQKALAKARALQEKGHGRFVVDGALEYTEGEPERDKHYDMVREEV